MSRISAPSSIEGRSGAAREIAKLLPYSGPLLSVRLLDRGRHGWLLAGMVPQPALARVEPRLP